MPHHEGYQEALRRIAACRTSGAEELDLGGLQLEEIPPQLLELDWLKRLYLGPSAEARENISLLLGHKDGKSLCNAYNSLPDALSTALSKLEFLDVSFSLLVDLSPIGELKGLTKLHCSGTKVSSLAPVTGLTGLTEFNCGYTQVSDLCPLADLKCLAELHCVSTQIFELKPLAELTGLRVLNLSSTQIDDLTPLAGLTNLRTLYFWDTKVESLDPITELTGLTKLHFSSTQVADLSSLAKLANLTELHCLGTRVRELTPISELTGLTILNCSSTQISDLAPISELTGLKKLFCSATKVSDLKPLAELTSLTVLHCSATQVSDLTPIARLTDLTALHCRATQVNDLTPLAELSDLTELNCSFCDLKNVPPGLWQRPNLSKLILFDSKVPGIPDEVLSSDVHDNCLLALRAHLADLGDDPEPLTDVKLMVLGNGRIGKTQICNRLRGLNFDAEADSTHGIQLTSAPIPEGTGQFNIWDFGGQDIYFGTHALFLKSRAVFLLVWTPETDNSDEAEHGGVKVRNRPVSWWLGTVRRLGDEKTPLIAVQNQLDRFPDAGEHPAVATLRQQDHYCRSLSYSAKTKEGEASLKERLQFAARQFNPPLIGKGRLEVIQRLRKLREDDALRPTRERLNRTQSFDDFQNLCNEVGGVSNTKLFLEFLHNAGEVFWQQGLFGDAIILDQAWVLEAVYSVFDRAKSYQYLLNRRGCFDRETLAMLLWDEAGYTRAEQELFLGFMQQAGICFAASSKHRDLADTIFVAPDLLPEHYADEGITGPIRGICHTLEFPTLPPGFMRNVIVRVGRNAEMNCHYWRHGFCGYDATTKARVRVEETIEEDWSGFITITAEGTQTDPLIKTLTKWIQEEAQLFGLETEEHRMPEQLEKLPEPNFQPDPKRPLNYFVSYAWADKGDPDRARIVDEFCQNAGERGIQIRRDRNELNHGDSITEFMTKLVRGDRIVIVLTKKYLHSPNCMFELCEIWRLSRADPAEFREKVRLFTASDAKIFTSVDRAKVARHWRKTHAAELQYLDDMGPADRERQYKVSKIAVQVGEILEVVADTLQPRTLEDLLDYALA